MSAKLVPYPFVRRSAEEMRVRAAVLLAEMQTRRSGRFFSDEPVPRDLIET